MSDNTQLLQNARALHKQGDRHQARALVRQALQENPDDYRAWLWLATLAPSPAAALEYIHHAEKLRPNDATVRRARTWAEKRLAAQSAVASVPPAATPQPQPPAPSAESSSPAFAGVAGRLNGRWRWFVGTAVILILACGFILGGLLWFSGQTTPEVAESDSLSGAQSMAALPDAEEGATDGVAGGAASEVVAAQPVAAPATATPTHIAAAPHVLAKQVISQPDEPVPTWTPTPSPTPTPLPTNTPVPTATPFPTFIAPDSAVLRPYGVGISERWIDVDLGAQTLTAFEGNTPVFKTLISSGLWGTPTVVGQFRIYLRYESQTMNGYLLGYDYYLENVPYVQYFFEDYALHGAYWHDNFGNPMSHGCVNMRPEDAEWLYHWSGIGTLVNVHH